MSTSTRIGEEWDEGGEVAPEAPGARAYHGTDAVFDKFDIRKAGSATDEGDLGKGFYFSTDSNIGRTSKYTMEVDLNFSNPLKMEMETWADNKRNLIIKELDISSKSNASEIRKILKDRGYDSVVLDYSKLGYNHQEIMIMDSNKIKFIGR